MKHSKHWMVVILIVAGLIFSACTQASAPKTKSSPVKVEPIEGSDLKRVVLTEKAAERLDVQTAPVEESAAIRQWTIGGRVAALPAAAGGALLVRVPLSESDLARVDQGQPAHVLPLDDAEDNDEGEDGLEAEAADDPEDADPEEAAVYYSVKNQGKKALAQGQAVRVKLALTGNGTSHKVIPYAAVIYDVNGKTWVYTNPEPLVFIRQSISVDYVEGDLAYLTDGPATGAKVVTVAGAELYGAETGVSK